MIKSHKRYFHSQCTHNARLIFGYFSFYRSRYDVTAESETGIELNCLNEEKEKEGTL